MLRIEQDHEYVSEQCSVTKRWYKTKRVMKNTYTVYETVGKPSYETPVYFAKNYTEAQEYISKNKEKVIGV